MVSGLGSDLGIAVASPREAGPRVPFLHSKKWVCCSQSQGRARYRFTSETDLRVEVVFALRPSYFCRAPFTAIGAGLDFHSAAYM